MAGMNAFCRWQSLVELLCVITCNQAVRHRHGFWKSQINFLNNNRKYSPKEILCVPGDLSLVLTWTYCFVRISAQTWTIFSIWSSCHLEKTVKQCHWLYQVCLSQNRLILDNISLQLLHGSNQTSNRCFDFNRVQAAVKPGAVAETTKSLIRTSDPHHLLR